MPGGHDISPRDIQGTQTAPAVPASTVALTNPYPFACLVTLRGGIVTVVSISGNTITLLGSLYVLPLGGTITLTYSVAPSWDWWGLA